MELNFNIFISHDKTDEAVAIELKNFLENIFLSVNVYVSGRDLEGGQTWIENIKLKLKSSQVIIGLITKSSIDNNWLYFEIGSGFTGDKSIPLLADNLKFGDLQPPLGLLQARTLSNTGIKSLVTDISAKLNLRTPQNLVGLDKLLEESARFFNLKNSDNAKHQSKVSKKESWKLISNENDIGSKNYDPELRQAYEKTVNRAKDLIKRKVLTYTNKYDLPTTEELDELKLSEIQKLARAFNIKTPSIVVMNLSVGDLSFPKTDARKWEKMNTQKMIDNANQELDKFEKLI